MKFYAFQSRSLVRFLAVITVLTMVVGLLPLQTFAFEQNNGQQQNQFNNGNDHNGGNNGGDNHNNDNNNNSDDHNSHNNNNNDDRQGGKHDKGSVTVTKVVVGTTTVSASDFDLSVGATSVVSGQTKNDVPVGAYTVTETAHQGIPTTYTASFSGDCASDGSISITKNSTATCTITNTYPEPTPTPKKDDRHGDDNHGDDHHGDDNHGDDNHNSDHSSQVISGCKFNDLNGNGVWDKETEGTLSNWGIELLHTNDLNTVVDSTTTGEDGCYSFTVDKGDWTVREVQQEGWTQTAPEVGTCEFDLQSSGNDNQHSNQQFFSFNNNNNDGEHGDNHGNDNHGDDNHGNTHSDNVCDFGNHQQEQQQQSQCEIGVNLLQNGSFETPVGTDASGWDIFASGTSGLSWLVSWVSAFVGAPTTANIELHHGVNGWLPSNGSQYAELDSDWGGPSSSQTGEEASTKISQTVTTEPGATYELRYDFSPRPGTGLADNVLNINAGGVTDSQTADGSSNSQTDWHTYSDQFVATGTQSVISFADGGTANSVGTLLDNAVLCKVKDAPICEDQPNGAWADTVVSSDQGNRKDGGSVLAARSNPNDTLGASDWSSGGTSGFYSLGFGGSIVLAFSSYVPDVSGADLHIHEATNGTYPLETATVEVSQDGSTWKFAGTADNTGVGKISDIDFSSTGYTWIKFVRITDTSNPAIHSNDADGFDLDAVEATQEVCTQPVQPEPHMCTIHIVSDTSDLSASSSANAVLVSTPYHVNWTAVVGDGAKWIWGIDPIADPVNQTSDAFSKSFNWNGTVASATLTIAADNSYIAKINGNTAASDATEFNYQTATTHDVTSLIQTGANTLNFSVVNFPLEGGTVATNPAGLIYDLSITGDNADCNSDGGGDNGGGGEPQKYMLHIDTTGEGTGVVDSEGNEIHCDKSDSEESTCEASFDAGTSVTLTVTPGEGSNFNDSWENTTAGTCTDHNSPCTVTMNSDINLTAHFSLDDNNNGGGGTQQAKTRTNGSGSGTIPNFGVGGGDGTLPPIGQVLGAATSVMPVGAPNTGAGGTSTNETAVNVLIALLSIALFGSILNRLSVKNS